MKKERKKKRDPVVMPEKFSGFMKQQTGIFASDWDFVLVRLPTIDELEEFLCDIIPKTRMIRLHISGDCGPRPLYFHKTCVEDLTKLALKYRPWQYRWLSQESGSIEISWVEVADWYYKYENKLGWVEKCE